MRIRNAVLAAAAIAAGCGGPESCPTETPKVQGVEATCIARPGATVAYPIQYCDPTGVTCDADLSAAGSPGGSILLDPKVQVCGGGSASCPASCVLAPFAKCSFTAPAAVGTYQVFAFDSCSTSNREGQLVVTNDQPPTPDCQL